MSKPDTTVLSSLEAVRKITGSCRARAAAHTPKPEPSASCKSTRARSNRSRSRASRAECSPAAAVTAKPSSRKKSVSRRTMASSSSASSILCICAPSLSGPVYQAASLPSVTKMSPACAALRRQAPAQPNFRRRKCIRLFDSSIPQPQRICNGRRPFLTS